MDVKTILDIITSSASNLNNTPPQHNSSGPRGGGAAAAAAEPAPALGAGPAGARERRRVRPWASRRGRGAWKAARVRGGRGSPPAGGRGLASPAASAGVVAVPARGPNGECLVRHNATCACHTRMRPAQATGLCDQHCARHRRKRLHQKPYVNATGGNSQDPFATMFLIKCGECGDARFVKVYGTINDKAVA
ncbi:Protein of unknown function [Gryllus bimaculatus]|nr:Protein of unknown function [Gryllus bimaculatus]